MKTWAKLSKEQIKMLGFATYDWETILIDYSAEKVDDSFYFNAQEYFSEEELAAMPDFGTELFNNLKQIYEKVEY